MPRSYNPMTYPMDFWEILEQVAEDREVVRVDFEGEGAKGKAQKLRFVWYGFTGALEKQRDDERYVKAWGQKCLVSAVISEGPKGNVQVVFSHRETNGLFSELNATMAKRREGRKEKRREELTEGPGAGEKAVEDLYG